MPIQFWFVCKDKECRGSFPNVESFIEHKKEKHFSEFQSTNCFVFDEREKQFPVVVPQNPSEDENSTGSSSFQLNDIRFLITIEESHDDESRIDSSASNIETEPGADEFQPESILPHPYVKRTNPGQSFSLRTDLERNNNINDHNYYDAESEPSAFIASPSQSPSFDTFVDADFSNQSQLNSPDTANRILDITVTDTDTEETGIPADSNNPDEEYLEIIPKTEVIEFENEYDSQGSETELTGMQDDVNDGTIIKSSTNPYVLLKRLTAKEIQSALDYRKVQGNQQVILDLEMETKLLTRVTIHSAKHRFPSPARLESEFQIKCNFCCAKKFKSERYLKLHLNSCLYNQKNKNRHHYCTTCNKLLGSPYYLQHHCERVHKITKREFYIKMLKFKCQLCAAEFESIENLSIHTQDHVKNEKMVKKRRCKSAYAFAPSKERPFVCSRDRCGRAYPTKLSLQTHLRLTKCGDPFVCQHINCCQSFRGEKSFKIHRLSHSQSQKPKPKTPAFTCGKCGVSFKEQDSLLQHLKNHSNEIPFKCSYPNCEKSFQNKTSLSEHSDSHFEGFRRFPEELVLGLDEFLY